MSSAMRIQLDASMFCGNSTVQLSPRSCSQNLGLSFFRSGPPISPSASLSLSSTQRRSLRRQDLTLSDHADDVMKCIESLDEHGSQRLDLEGFCELCRSLGVSTDDSLRAFQRAPHDADGRVGRADILRIMFPSYTTKQVNLEMRRHRKQTMTPSGYHRPISELQCVPSFAKELFRMCGGEEKQSVTLSDIAPMLPSVPTEDLRAMIQLHCPEMSLRRAFDRQTSQRFRIADFFARLHLPDSLTQSVITRPPLSIRSIENNWEEFRPLFEKKLDRAQMSRLSHGVRVLRRFGPQGVFRIKWPENVACEPSVPDGVQLECERDLAGNSRPPIDVENARLPLQNFAEMLTGAFVNSASPALQQAISRRERAPPFGVEYIMQQHTRRSLPRPNLCRVPAVCRPQRVESPQPAEDPEEDHHDDAQSAKTQQLTKREIAEREERERERRCADVALLHSVNDGVPIALPPHPRQHLRFSRRQNASCAQTRFPHRVPHTSMLPAEVTMQQLRQYVATQVLSGRRPFSAELQECRRLEHFDILSSTHDAVLATPRREAAAARSEVPQQQPRAQTQNSVPRRPQSGRSSARPRPRSARTPCSRMFAHVHAPTSLWREPHRPVSTVEGNAAALRNAKWILTDAHQ